MSDIRINALATTASTTASDDYIAIDGSANGTRKLSAYSPTFGGNLTVSGTGAISNSASTSAYQTGLRLQSTAGSSPNTMPAVEWYSSSLSAITGSIYSTRTAGSYASSLTFQTLTGAGALTTALTLDSSQNATLAGNLTVSGTGTSTFAGLTQITSSGDYSLTAIRSSGASGVIARAGLMQHTTSLASSDGLGSALAFGIAASGLAQSVIGDIAFVRSGGDTTGDFVVRPYAAGTAAVQLTLKSGGNLLLGTTTDNGLGKLQVNGPIWSVASFSSYSNDGLWSATATPFIVKTVTNSNVRIGYSSTGGGDYAPRIGFGNDATGTKNCFIGSATGGAYDSLVLGTNSTTALTLDSSQNATFAGNVYGTGNLVLLGGSATNANIYLRAQGTGYVRVDTGSGFRVETGKVAMTSLPTSSTGLSSGDLWIDTSAGRVIKVVA